jgi:signal peptidase I
VLADALLVVAVLAVSGLVAGAVCGYRVLVIRGGSMLPTLQVGDVVLSRSTAPAAVRPGDVVTFSHPALHGQAVTHRVVAIERIGDRFVVRTRGDANQRDEQWTVGPDDRVGREVRRLPALGPWLLWLRDGPAAVAAVLLLSALLGGMALRRVWSR